MIPMAYKQHIEARDLAIERLVSLSRTGIDIGDKEIFISVLARHGLLSDGFESDIEYIVQEVKRRVR